MTDYEMSVISKVVNGLRHHAYDTITSMGAFIESLPDAVLDDTLPNTHESQWISVDDRLPEDGLLGKLVYTPGNGIEICRQTATLTLSSGKKVISAHPDLMSILFSQTSDSTTLEDVTHITHWMEPPKPPQEGTADDEVD